MAMPYSVRVAIDSFREEEPTFSTLSDEQIYKHLKTYEPHLEWFSEEIIMNIGKKILKDFQGSMI